MIPTNAVDSTGIVEYTTGFTPAGRRASFRARTAISGLRTVLANEVAKITTAGVITAFTASGAPTGITKGPDGNLWFTEQSGNNIGQITTAGVITLFAIPTSDSEPTGIAAAPDGNIWFTECTGNNIGKVVL